MENVELRQDNEQLRAAHNQCRAELAAARKVADAAVADRAASDAYIRARNRKPIDRDALISLQNAWDIASVALTAAVREYRAALQPSANAQGSQIRTIGDALVVAGGISREDLAEIPPGMSVDEYRARLEAQLSPAKQAVIDATLDEIDEKAAKAEKLINEIA